MSEVATCKVCLDDYELDSMIQDIRGANYCLLDSRDICLVCGGVYSRNCEEASVKAPQRTVNDIKREEEESE